MYYASGVAMLVPGIYFFIMNYYNYKKLGEEERQRQSIDMQMKTSVSGGEEAASQNEP